jgi:hypothetical protein
VFVKKEPTYRLQEKNTDKGTACKKQGGFNRFEKTLIIFREKFPETKRNCQKIDVLATNVRNE